MLSAGYRSFVLCFVVCVVCVVFCFARDGFLFVVWIGR